MCLMLLASNHKKVITLIDHAPSLISHLNTTHAQDEVQFSSNFLQFACSNFWSFKILLQVPKCSLSRSRQ